MDISKAELEGLILERTSELLSTSRQLREERRLRGTLELSLGHLRELQAIVAEQTSQLLVLQDAAQFPQIMDQLLRKTARFLGVDYACVVAIGENGQPFQVLREWRSPSVDEHGAVEAILDPKAMLWFFDRLGSMGSVVLDGERVSPEIAQAEKHWLQQQGVESFWAFALYQGERLGGYLGYLHRQKSRTWPLEFQDSFRILANTLALALRRTQMQAETRQLGDLLDLTMSSLREGVMLVDAREFVTMVNEAALALLGRPKTHVLGRPLVDVLRISEARDAEPSRFPLRLIRRGGLETQQQRFMLMDTHNTVRAVVELRSQAVLATDGSRHGDVLVFRDVSGESGFEQEQKIQGKLRSVGHLAAGLAHEISTPMQYISDNTSFLRDVLRAVIAVRERYFDAIDARCNEAEKGLAEQLRAADADLDIDFNMREAFTAIDQTIAGVEKVGTLVTAMKSLARYANRGRQLIDLNLAVREVMTLTDHEWRYVAEIVLKLSDDLPETCVDIEEINQVLIEIIGNACDSIQRAMSAGLIALGQITLRTALDGNQILIEITDNGMGMSEMVKQRMFDPFFSTKELGSGAGQGMNLAWEVVVIRHGGSIEVESEEGKGARICIRLPLIRNVKLEDEPAMP